MATTHDCERRIDGGQEGKIERTGDRRRQCQSRECVGAGAGRKGDSTKPAITGI
jgi:hypothetical protein